MSLSRLVLWISVGYLALASWTSLAVAQREIAVTVYNRDLALVREQRTIEVSSGVSEIQFTDVAARLDPTSVHLVPRRAGAFRVLEQNFRFDLASTERLLERSLGGQIRVTDNQGNITSGELVFFDNGSLILETGDEVRMLYRHELREQVIPELPGGLVSRPTLAWLVDTGSGGSQAAQLSYLTGGMSWHAEYVAVVNPGDTALNLSSWVSVLNQSGATYPDAHLKLVAGDVHRVQDIMQREVRAKAMAVAEAPPQFQQREFFEFHLYDLERATTIADRETKQISLFPPTDVRQIEKKYTFDAEQRGPKVVVTLEFKNSRGVGLGIALPAGKVRVYKEDRDGSQEFVGEDLIDHTPRDEKVVLTVGRPFDVVAERKQLDYQRLSNRVSESTFEIELRNRKQEAITVLVVEHPRGDWEITESSHEFQKKEAFTIEFPVRVGAGAEVKVSYTVRVRTG